jgi:hypothetical protein
MLRSGVGALALALLVAVAARAEDQEAEGKISCTMEFSMKGWAAIYRTAHGGGTITCSNGEKMEVALDSKGVGVAAGKGEVTGARGVFSPVEHTEELFGNYVGRSAAAAAGEANVASAFVKGDVSLALYGQGKGIGLAKSGSTLTITRKDAAKTEK